MEGRGIFLSQPGYRSDAIPDARTKSTGSKEDGTGSQNDIQWTIAYSN